MNKGVPKVSVVMPVYNNELYVGEAIESIIHQAYINWEFIIIDDGSTDSTFQIISSYNDIRIKIIQNRTNKGNYIARNQGFLIAKGKYICVMDSDDISLPNRIQEQVEFMEDNVNYGVCGGAYQILGSEKIITPPNNHEEIKIALLSNIILLHPTWLIRAELLKKFDLKYNLSYKYAADYDLLVKFSQLTLLSSVKNVILYYRRHSNQISTANLKCQAAFADRIRIKQLLFFNINPSFEKNSIHLKLVKGASNKKKQDFSDLLIWANYLLDSNKELEYFRSDLLSQFLRNTLKNALGFHSVLIKEKNNI
jgi:glycosyltransferase involved in cell wall biosynthesis